MKLINNHIANHLNRFIGEQEIDHIIFDNIENHPKKKRYLKLLKYIDYLIDFKSDIILNSLHLHLENDLDEDMEAIIFELIVAKSYFFQKKLEDLNLDERENNTDLRYLIDELQKKYNSIVGQCPEGAISKNGGNLIFKKWILQKYELRCLLNHYESINPKSTFLNKTLINCKVRLKNRVSGRYSLKPIAVDINNSDFKFSCNIINCESSLNDLDQKWEFIDSTTNIIMFDCESKRIMLNYSQEELNKWNEEHGTNFKNYFVITFGNATHSINKTKEKIQIIQDRFKINKNNSYTITNSEFNCLLKNKTESPNMDFIGFESSNFWDTFILETSIRELYELRSIKLMNIYSICYSQDIKNYIISDLFSKNHSSELISSNTKMAILELIDEDIDVLEKALSNTLEVIIDSYIKSKVLDTLSNNPTIILDESILRNQKLLSKIGGCLSIKNTSKFKTWSALTNSNLKNLLILSYRDQGRYPNYYYPNLLELDLDSDCVATVILPNFIFINYYNWAKYNLYNDYYNLLNHPIREKHFEWNSLKNKIQGSKPKKKLGIDWNLESEYSNIYNRE